MEAQNRLVTQQSAVSNMVQLFAAYIKARQDLKLVFYTLGVIGGFSSNSKSVVLCKVLFVHGFVLCGVHIKIINFIVPF